MARLASRHCTPIREGSKPIGGQTASSLLKKLTSDWALTADISGITRIFKFKNYYETIAFVNAVAWIAHQEDHHPDLKVGYNTCEVLYSTHSVAGLSVNDFICAAKIDTLIGQQAISIPAKPAASIAPPPAPTPVGEVPVEEKPPATQQAASNATEESLQLNLAEVEEMLKKPTPAIETQTEPQQEEEEIQLIDPNAATLVQRQAEAEKSVAATLDEQNQAIPAPSAPIIPPGMSAVETSTPVDQDEDEEATVIMSPEMMSEIFTSRPVHPQPIPNDTDDEAKTMMLNQEPDEAEKTMIITHPPINQLESLTENPQSQAANTADSNTQTSAEKPEDTLKLKVQKLT